LSIDTGDTCGYNAQHIGVAKVKKTPQNAICKGAGAHFIFLNRPLLSIASIITGVITTNKTMYVLSVVLYLHGHTATHLNV